MQSLMRLTASGARAGGPCRPEFSGCTGVQGVSGSRHRGWCCHWGVSQTCRGGCVSSSPEYMRTKKSTCKLIGLVDMLLRAFSAYLDLCCWFVARGGAPTEAARDTTSSSQKKKKNLEMGVPDPPRLLPDHAFVA